MEEDEITEGKVGSDGIAKDKTFEICKPKC